MADADLEALRRGYEAWNRGDLSAVLALVDPDIEWRPGEDAPESGERPGRDGFQEFIESWTESFDGLRIEPVEFVEIGDDVVTVVRQKRPWPRQRRGARRRHRARVDHPRGRGGGVDRVPQPRGRPTSAARPNERRTTRARTSQLRVVQRERSRGRARDVRSPTSNGTRTSFPGPAEVSTAGTTACGNCGPTRREIFGDFRNVPEEMFDAGDQIVIFVRVEGVGAMSGVAVEARIAHVMTFRGEKVVTVQSLRGS